MNEPWQNHWLDYYAILEISENASFEEIKKKYRKLARKYHPDFFKENTKEQAEAKQKFQNINEAYQILSDEKRRAAYDEAYHNNQNSNTQEVSYEDIKKNYTVEEQKYAKTIALKELITEELEKAKELIDAKNEIIFSAYDDNVDKKEYYNSVKELVSIGYEYIKKLEDLINESEKYELHQEVELLTSTIEYLEQELNNIPLSKSAACKLAKELNFKEATKNEIKKAIEECNNLISELKKVPSYCTEHLINPLNYNEIIRALLLDSRNMIGKLRGYEQLCIKLELKEEKALLLQVLAELREKMLSLPNNYEEALKLAKRDQTIEKIQAFINKWNESLPKLKNFNSFLQAEYTNENYDKLYQENKTLLNDFFKQAIKLCNEAVAFDYNTTNKEEAHKLSMEAIELFQKSEETHNQANTIFDSMETLPLSEDEKINTILNSVLATWDKNKALELFTKVNELLETLKQFRGINLQALIGQLRDIANETITLKKSFDDAYMSIDKLENVLIFYKMEVNSNKLIMIASGILSIIDFIANWCLIKINIAKDKPSTFLFLLSVILFVFECILIGVIILYSKEYRENSIKYKELKRILEKRGNQNI